jgi:hypothetical protein
MKQILSFVLRDNIVPILEAIEIEKDHALKYGGSGSFRSPDYEIQRLL